MEINTNIDGQADSIETDSSASASQLESQGLQTLKEMQALARILTTREVRRLENKLGSDNPRVKDLQEGLKRNFANLQDAEQMVSNQAITTPQLAEGDTLVQGKVQDENGKGVTGLTILMQDSSGAELAIDKVKTDAAGYFAAVISPDVMEQAQANDWTFSVQRDDGTVVYTLDKTINLAAGKNLLINTVVSRENTRPAAVTEFLQRPVSTTTTPPAAVDIAALIKEGYLVLGNKRTKEMHDLNNIQKQCQIDEIVIKHRVPFKSDEEGVVEGYDYCAYCYGPEKSQR